MKVQVNFKHVNSSFDKERFEWHDGEEPDNRKYHTASTFGIEEVESKGFNPSVSITIYVTLTDDTEKQFTIDNMSEFECKLSDGSIEKFFASKSIIRNTHETYDSKSDTARFYFYLKDSIEFGSINNVTCVAGEDFPEEMLEAGIKELKTDYESKAKLIQFSGGYTPKHRPETL